MFTRERERFQLLFQTACEAIVIIVVLKTRRDRKMIIGLKTQISYHSLPMHARATDIIEAIDIVGGQAQARMRHISDDGIEELTIIIAIAYLLRTAGVVLNNCQFAGRLDSQLRAKRFAAIVINNIIPTIVDANHKADFIIDRIGGA